MSISLRSWLITTVHEFIRHLGGVTTNCQSWLLKWNLDTSKCVGREPRIHTVHKCSINSQHCLIQFKILHRLYSSKIRLHRIFPDVSPPCEKWESMDATLSHSYTLCPKLQEYWCDIFHFLPMVLEVQIAPDPISDYSGNIWRALSSSLM